MDIKAIERKFMEELPAAAKGKGKPHPLAKYRQLLTILKCKGYTKHNMHRKLQEADLNFTSSQVIYYLSKHPLTKNEINQAEEKILKMN